MALSDIIAAIIKEADMQIAAFKQQHDRAVASAKSVAQEEHQKAAVTIDVQKHQKMDQIRRKAEQSAEFLRCNAVLQRKRALLDEAYAAVLDVLSKKPEVHIEPLLCACLATLHDGEIRPAKMHVALLQKLIHGKKFTMGKSIEARGGFLCVSKTQEHDFRFETIVTQVLRPQTELQVALDLFSASRK